VSIQNPGASIRSRLLNKAKAEKLDFNLLLTRFALERMLYRLSVSSQQNQFLLKGALLFDLWFDVPHRPTHDADLLSFGSPDIPHLVAVFRDICRIENEDGIVFDPNSVKGAEIRKEANYAGIRITLLGLLDNARCPVQVDVGFGDAVVPGPESVSYPIILSGMDEPQLRAYPRYTVVAEKLEALTSLGMLNSRMKDFFDLWVLAKHSDFEGGVLLKAVIATFERRGTKLPEAIPIGLSEEFLQDDQKNKQWTAFIRKNSLTPMLFETVIRDLQKFLLPVLAAASTNKQYEMAWLAGAGWSNHV